MTTKAKRDRFAELCAAIPLRPIQTEAQLEAAESLAHTLLRKSRLTRDEHDYLDTLSLLIERYEDEHFPEEPDALTPAGALRYIMEQHGAMISDVAAATGITVAALSAMVDGKRAITAEHVPVLARYFGVGTRFFQPQL